jgi:predicted RNA-binding protein with PIN domain
LTYPADLKPYLRQSRVPTSALGKLRRAIEADSGFRTKIAAGALPELVDPIGIEWLRREDGWEARVADLIAAAEADAEQADAEAALRRSERKREAAEQAAIRTRVELIQLQSRIDELTASVEAQRQQAATAASELTTIRADLAEARAAARHANDRADAARRRLESIENERDEARRRADTAETRRDELLAERAERAGVRVPAERVGELDELARTARSLADRLGGLAEVRTGRRRALALPGGVAGESPRATEYLLRATAALVLVDGYNVAKLAWPEAELALQRERCLDLVDDIARRFSSEVVVVFDGAEVVGSHATKRRLARVSYSRPGESADDVIRNEVKATPTERPVVVVTNDRAIRRDVAADGANVISSNGFLAVAR